MTAEGGNERPRYGIPGVEDHACDWVYGEGKCRGRCKGYRAARAAAAAELGEQLEEEAAPLAPWGRCPGPAPRAAEGHRCDFCGRDFKTREVLPDERRRCPECAVYNPKPPAVEPTPCPWGVVGKPAVARQGDRCPRCRA